MVLRRAVDRVGLLRRIAREVLPLTASELARWEARIASIPNAELRRQARASITLKRFHCEGGSVFAALRPGCAPTLVRLIVALQTISDYLDNLCDRSVSCDEADFRQLHQAMLDAVDDAGPLHDYYSLHPNREDGGYLVALVRECQACLRELPSYPLVRERVQRLVGLYNDLQVYKHGPLERRETQLEDWFAREGDAWRELYWWEFAAACGSTLAVFALLAAAALPGLRPDEAERLEAAYFPWICGLHILLDYLIDQAEDTAGGDLNLVSYYPDPVAQRLRLVRFVREARSRAAALPDPAFHATVVEGLPGLYLSDSKVRPQRLHRVAWDLLAAGGPASWGYYVWCRLRRLQTSRRRPPNET